MENTERAGGTRYSAGKPVANWAPWLGLEYVYDIARTVATNPLYEGGDSTERDIELQVESVYSALRECMRSPLVLAGDDRMMLAHAGYLLLDLLHQRELVATLSIIDRPSPTLPVYGMHAVLDVSNGGADKYAPLDWTNGQSFTTLLSSAMRHAEKMVAFDAYALDPESGHMHAGHCAWNVLAILDFVSQGRTQELDNVTPWHGVTAAMRKQYGLTQRSTAYEILLAKSIDEQHAGQQRQRQVAQQIKYRDAARDRDVRDAISESMMSLVTLAAQKAPADAVALRRMTDVEFDKALADFSTRTLEYLGEQVPELACIDDNSPVDTAAFDALVAPPVSEGYGPPKIVR